MKKCYFVIIFVLFVVGAKAQPFGNEWINYSQKYYTVKVFQNGIYRIDSLALANAGIDLSAIDARSLQIFGREKEQPVYVYGESDGVFNSTDYIEFLGLKNDGWLDSLLYGGVQNMSDTYFSLYNDTATYYITYNSSLSNLRATPFTDTSFSSYALNNYFIYKPYIKLTSEYWVGPQIEGASRPKFNYGEGWVGVKLSGIPGGTSFTFSLLTPNIYNAIGAPNANITVVGHTNSNAVKPAGVYVNHHMQISYGSPSIVIYDSTLDGYQMVKKSIDILPTTLSSPATGITFSVIDDIGVASDYINANSMSIRYPHTTTLSGETNIEFEVPFEISQPFSNYNLNGFSGSSYVMYMIGDATYRASGTVASGNLKFLVPNAPSTNATKCYLFNGYTPLTVVKPYNGTGNFTNYGALNVDSAYLIVTHPSLNASSNNYASYRSSSAGGNYNTVVVNINELYDQFAAGIYKHSIATRRFCDYVSKTWPSTPKYLFLIGKSIRDASEGNNGAFPGIRMDIDNYAECLVPTYGYPSTDILITAGLGSTNLEPLIPTGRLAAHVSTEVDDYLNKVIEYEAAQANPIYTKSNKDWMKHVLEFGGGSTTFEQVEFKGYLKSFQSMLEDTLFGGKCDLFFKTSSEPIDPIDFSTVSNRLNDGVSLMIFFGHGSIGGFDQNIDDVSNWNNQGKYPLLIANSCYSGDIHQPGSTSVSEQFTLFPDKGVIAFVASVKQGFVSTLAAYSDSVIYQIASLSYNQSIGNCMKKGIAQLQNYITTTEPLGLIVYEEVYQGMTLHGDPAIRINPHNKPELVIESSDVFITPSTITLATDSMDVNIVVTNLGKGTYAPFIAKCNRRFPGGADSTYIKFVNGVRYKDTIVFRMPVQHSLALGVNTFSLSVDVETDLIAEQYDEVFNNQITFDYTFSGNAIYPVYPYNYAIVPDSIISVSASTVNPLEQPKKYRFELDTTDLYNSPFKRYYTVIAQGGVVSVPNSAWLLQSTGVPSPLVNTDSTVYYWRVSPDSSTYLWEEFSYQYIPGKAGWGQSHYFQFKNNQHVHLGYNRPERDWKFETLNEVIKVNVFGDIQDVNESYNTAWYQSGQLQEYDGLSFTPTIFLGVIDPYESEAWHTFDGRYPDSDTNWRYYGQYNCKRFTGIGRNRGEFYFGFWQDAANAYQLDSLVSLMTNKIPCGNFFVLYTYNYADFPEWDAHNTNMYSLMASLGVDSIYPGHARAPFIIMGRMCDPSSIKYIVGDTITDNLTFSDSITGILPGIMNSVKIGPAYSWNSLYWKQHPLEGIAGDSTRLSVYGINNAGVETKLIDTNFSQLDSILNLNSIINAVNYPYLRLRATAADVVNITPALFDRWQILYEPVPEAALNPSDGYLNTYITDSIAEGNTFKFAMAIKNISNYDMDSLLVHYWVEDANRIKNYISYTRQDSLRAGQILLDTITINTLDYPGKNYLWIEANPVPLLSTLGTYDQLEQYHFNNIARIPFTVSTDNINPILDVTFDGRHILNGDIVSTKAYVVMTLDDENQFLLMNQISDTSRFIVKLTNPAGNQTPMYFNRAGVEQMRFVPAGSDNKSKIEWNAKFTMDGIYKLTVKAWDKSDNRSGGNEYTIEFEVISKQTVTNMMNWPNPFSTKTHFVFTLTGSELPAYIKIQIFNISGKVVREITMDELGPLYIGRNVTDYAWDGKDQFGDQLANGVYFYRVFTKNAGLTDVEIRDSGADQYFKKGFGKMYLMR